MPLAPVLHQIGHVCRSSILSEDNDFQMWLTTRAAHHITPTFAGKLCYSLSVLFQWTVRRISNYQKQPWHKLVSVTWNAFQHFQKCFLVKWHGINPIILLVDHSFHSEKLLISPNEDFVCGTLNSSNLFFCRPNHFCLEAFEITCHRGILYCFSLKSSFTNLISLSAISSSFAIFLITLFLTASMTLQVQTEQFLSGIVFSKVVSSTETFSTH